MSFDTLLAAVKGNKLLTAAIIIAAGITAGGAVASTVQQYRWWVYRSELTQAEVTFEQKLRASEAALDNKIRSRAIEVDERDIKQQKAIEDIQCNVLFTAITGAKQTIRDMEADIQKSYSSALQRELDIYHEKLRLYQLKYADKCNK